jgi:hypothetical protein
MSEPVTPFERLLADELRAHLDAARLDRPAEDVVTDVTSRPTTRPVVRGPLFGRLATVLAGGLAVLLVVLVAPRLALAPATSSPTPSASAIAPPVDRADMTSIDGVRLSDDGRVVHLEFIGGPPFDPVDQCSVAYSAHAAVVGDELHLAVWESGRPAQLLPVECPAVGYHRQIEVALDEPFEGYVARDLKGLRESASGRSLPVLFLSRPPDTALLDLPAGWELAEEATIMDSATGGWRQSFTSGPSSAMPRGQLVLYQFFGHASPYGGDGTRSRVEVNGQPATLSLEPNGQILVRWRLGEHGLTILAHGADFSAEELIALAETARLPSSSAPTPSPDPAPATPSLTPQEAVAQLTNPDGPDPADYAPDEYPLIETAYGLPTFAQLWIDDNQRDVHIALTGDVDGAIEALRDGVPRGVTVYFHIVEHTQDELCAIRDQMFADREELMRRGIVLWSGGCGNANNRVEVGLSPLTPEVLAYMRSRYAGPIAYEGSGSSMLMPYEPLELAEVRLDAVREGDDLGLSTCGGRPFPAETIERAPSDIETEGDEYRALRQALDIYVDVYGDLNRLGWILAEKDEYGATFLADRGDTWLEAPVFAGRDGWVPGTIDYCSPRRLTGDEGGNAALYLDPAYPEPDRTATVIHVLVEEQACASGSSPADRLLPPMARFTRDSVTLTIRVRRVGGAAACPGNPRLPVAVHLPEPLGDRTLRGVTTPPEY